MQDVDVGLLPCPLSPAPQRYVDTRLFAQHHSLSSSLIDRRQIACMLERHSAPEPQAVSLLKLEKTGGTTLASQIVSSCIAHSCASGNCSLSFAAVARACGSTSTTEALDAWQTCRPRENDDSALARALRSCMRLPLLVNKATTDLLERRRSLCFVAPQPASWATAPYRNFIAILREPLARRISALYYFNGKLNVTSMGGRALRAIDVAELTAEAMQELISVHENRQIFGPDPVQQLGGREGSDSAALARASALLQGHCVVGLTERPNATRALISLRLGLAADALVSCAHKRVGGDAHRRGPLAPAARVIAEAAFATERRLYARATELHAEQVRAFSKATFAAAERRVQSAQAAFSAACASGCGRIASGATGARPSQPGAAGRGLGAPIPAATVASSVRNATLPSSGARGLLILASGLEGSGTTSLCRVLAELPHALGVPSNWRISELSPTAKARHKCLETLEALQLVRSFGRVTQDLWNDAPPERRFVERGDDARDTSVRTRLLDEAARVLLRLLDVCSDSGVGGERPSVLVFHRSMPFRAAGSRATHTPFTHDLPAIAERLGLWGSRLVVSLRSIPEQWAARAAYTPPGDNVAFIGHIERLLRAEDALTTVRFDDLARRPQRYVDGLCAALLARVPAIVPAQQVCRESLSRSPQLSAPAREPTNHTGVDLDALTRRWQGISGRFPRLVHALGRA